MLKITDLHENEIIKDYFDGVRTRDIAEKYGISVASIFTILKRRNLQVKTPSYATPTLELLNEAITLYLNGERIKDISKKLNLSCGIIGDEIKRRKILKTDRCKLPDSIKQEILERIAKHESISSIRLSLGISHKKIRKTLNEVGIKLSNRGKLKYLTSEDEMCIVDDYVNKEHDTETVAKRYKISQKRVNSILFKHGYKKRKCNDTRMVLRTEAQKQEILDCLSKGLKLKEIPSALSFPCSIEAVSKFIKKEFPTSTRSLKERMILRYSPEHVEKLTKERSERMSRQMMGENSPRWGKPPLKKHSSGISGWYKEKHHFRSLKELSYIMYLEGLQQDWQSGEEKQFFIRYRDIDGRDKNYWPDFIIGGNKIVEIKPKPLHTNSHILAKAKAAIEFCSQKGWSYEIIDFEADLNKIKSAFDRRLINFSKNCEKRFVCLLYKKGY